ncbi:MAG: zinc ABC transporter substrate-binding protein [Pseudomonadota bacterium]
MNKRFILLYMTILCYCITFSGFLSNAQAVDKKFNILTSTFPIRLITLNIIHGKNNMNVDLLIPAQVGCPHDYALAPQDMKKLVEADVLIINGLGMEEFLGAPLEKFNLSLKTIDSSSGIKDILQHSDNADHHHFRTNPHLFASPRMTALLAKNIANGLSMIDPAGAGIYLKNARIYENKMNKLADEFSALGKRLKNKHIVTQHSVFDYLARDIGLKIVAVLHEYDGQEPSAAEILKIIKTIRNENAKAIFTEPQYPQKIGHVIATEAGIVTKILDPVATGPKNASLDYYETVMRKNIKILEKTLDE